MSLDDRTKAIVASNLTTAFHVEFASRRGNQGSPVDPVIGSRHPDASEEVFNTYLGFLRRLAEYDGSDHMKPE
jgi:hypothetical protein